MAEKRCGLGFSCALMMMQPGLGVADCPNRDVCGSRLSPEDIDLRRVTRDADYQVQLERMRVSRQEAALLMLFQRGATQDLESMGIYDQLLAIENMLAQVRQQLASFAGSYIAPEGAEVHTYNVKRPRLRVTENGIETWRQVYQYNKLMAATAIFEPSERSHKVRVIHLSHDDDYRNIEARGGIARRNAITQAQTQLRLAQAASAAALALLSTSEG